MRPTDRPRGPLEGWSIDLITGLEPKSPEGYVHCVVAIDCFSKWVEITPLRDKSSRTMAHWLETHLLPRFGKPRWIRADRGREFMGSFRELCDLLGITLRLVSPGRS